MASQKERAVSMNMKKGISQNPIQYTKLMTFCLISILMVTLNVWSQYIAITIDDSPEKDSKLYTATERSRLLIQELKDAGVDQAVFFSIGKKATTKKGYAQLMEYAHANHIIANHSYHHLNYGENNCSEYTNDILKAEKILAQFPLYKKWFRAPTLNEGDTKEKREFLHQFLKKENYVYGYVTVDNYEFY